MRIDLERAIKKDPVLNDFMRRPIDIKKFDHHVGLKFWTIRYALSKELAKIWG